MTEQNWLNFAGFLNNCNHGLNNKNCPFLKCQKLDQYAKLEYLLNISETDAENKLDYYRNQKNHCQIQEKKRPSKVISPELIPLSQNIEILVSI